MQFFTVHTLDSRGSVSMAANELNNPQLGRSWVGQGCPQTGGTRHSGVPKSSHVNRSQADYYWQTNILTTMDPMVACHSNLDSRLPDKMKYITGWSRCVCVRIFEPPGSCVCVEKQNTFQLHKNSDNNNKNNLHGGGEEQYCLCRSLSISCRRRFSSLKIASAK